MDDLHWALLIIGGLIILGIYLLSLRNPRRRETPADIAPPQPDDEDLRTELRRMSALLAEERRNCPTRPGQAEPENPAPDLHPPRETPPDEDAPPPAAQHELDFAPQPQPEPPKRNAWGLFGGQRASEPESAPLPELLLTIHVTAPSDARFAGQTIQNALEKAGLRFGVMDIYHRIPHGGTDHDAVFSVADMLEPGTLGAERLQDHQTPGLTLFLRLPGPLDGHTALDEMLSAARALAQRLGGEIRDERRSVLTRQTIEHMRERIVEHRRQRELAQRRAHGAPRDS